MKKFLLTLSILSTLVFISCGDDDEDMPDATVGLSGTISYDGGSFAISSGLISATEISNDVARRVFYLSDGILSSNGSNVTASGSQIVVTITAASTGTSTVVEGEYASSSDITGKKVDVLVQTSSGNETSFTGGTIDISGSENTFTLVMDVPFRGTQLSGTVSGTYESL